MLHTKKLVNLNWSSLKTLSLLGCISVSGCILYLGTQSLHNVQIYSIILFAYVLQQHQLASFIPCGQKPLMDKSFIHVPVLRTADDLPAWRRAVRLLCLSHDVWGNATGDNIRTDDPALV